MGPWVMVSASWYNAMRHIAVTGVHDEGDAVHWMEHVTDEQYMGG